MRKYGIVIELAGENWSAFAPDLPGVIAVGATPAECESNMREAIAVYLEELRTEGISPEPPVSKVAYVQVA